jgi:AcrR family transcriptional regulator
MTDPTNDAILDATRALVIDFGVRRTTLSDVARRAGVSRMTVYRRYPDVEALVRELMTREFGNAISEQETTVPVADTRVRVVRRVIGVTRALAANPLLRRILDVEPELVLPYLLGRVGETHQVALAVLVHEIREGQREGSVRAAPPETIALTLLLLAQTFLFGGASLDDQRWRELEHVVDAALRP